MTHDEPLPLGVFTRIDENPLEAVRKVKENGFPTCQVSSPLCLTREYAAEVRAALEETGVKISSMFIRFEHQTWNRVDGPKTIGFVPQDTRTVRTVRACRVIEFARAVGVEAVLSHVGFIPEDPDDAAYPPLVDLLRALAQYCKDNGQRFLFETGQETPATLLRTIEDVSLDNLGINLDPANLLLYGKGRPLEALDVFGQYVRSTHCKDGKWPTDDENLGEEMPLGEGDVNFPELIPKLYAMGFRGPLTIEREISGPKQTEDILKAKKLLEDIRAKVLAS